MNCIVDNPKYHGIHPGYSITGVSISNCFIYNCPNSGIYDCYNVNGLAVNNCYFENCYIGIGGLDTESNGSNITACTFEKCNTGIDLRATNGGTTVTGCTFQNCTDALNAYVGGTAAISGCMFVSCDKVLKLARAQEINFVGNTLRNCKNSMYCWTQPANPTIRNTNLIYSNNMIYATDSEASAKISLNMYDNAIIKGNLLSGNNAIIEIDTTTTSNIIVDNNIGEKIEINTEEETE